MNRKLISILLAVAFTLSLAGCSKQSDTASTAETTQTETSADSAVLSKINISASKAETVGEADTFIELGSNITVNGEGAKVENNKVTITSAGTYSIKGTLTDGQIIVNAGDNDKVYIILNGVNITSSNNAPIYVKKADKAVISLADNTENIIKDGEKYVLEDETSNEPNAAIFSKSDLIFIGNGSLNVDAKYKNGILSKDDLRIQGGNITVNAVADGIRGKDSVEVTNGNITVTAGEDGIKSTNAEDTEKGYVLIEGGNINITSGQDGIQGEINTFVKAGDITIKTGGGSQNAPTKHEAGPGMGMGRQATTSEGETESAKAIKAGVNIITEGGTFNLDSSEDAFHSNDNLVINAGIANISAGDDGVHADSTLTVNGGTINISKSYEGVEGENITINDGDINLISSDDGLNASGGNDGSGADGAMQGAPAGDAKEKPTDGASSSNQGNAPAGGPGAGEHGGQGGPGGSSNGTININGGKIIVNANGDGVDSNGSIYMKGGTLIINGPTSNGNGALDYDNKYELSGGVLVAAGSSGMAQAPSTSSTQNSIKVNLASQTANTLIHIENESGEEIVTFAPAKQYSSVVVSSPNIKTGSTYKVYLGGSSTGTAVNGLYSDGTYTKGQEIGSASISEAVTQITQEGVTASKGMGGGNHGPSGGGMKGPKQ